MSTSPPTPQPSSASPAGSKGAQLVKALVAVAALAAAGYYAWRQLQPAPGYQFNPATLAFVDQAQSNVPLDDGEVSKLQFVDTAGAPVDLVRFQPGKNVVLVVTRGVTSGRGTGAYDGNICLYCATQTSRLIANYKAFQDSDAEVVVVFPVRDAGESDQAQKFKQVVTRQGAPPGPPPFPLVLDVGLKAVDQLGIRADLSKPATYILDKQGQVRFAYVGASMADRPSVRSMLDQLNSINAESR